MKKHIDPTKVTQIHMVSDGTLTKGWVHTHGMHKYGLPELEIRGVQMYLASDAARLINRISDYLLNSGKTVKAGETMQLGPMCIVRFRKSSIIPGDEEHFIHERWELTDDAMTGKCADPMCTHEGHPS